MSNKYLVKYVKFNWLVDKKFEKIRKENDLVNILL